MGIFNTNQYVESAGSIQIDGAFFALISNVPINIVYTTYFHSVDSTFLDCSYDKKGLAGGVSVVAQKEILLNRCCGIKLDSKENTFAKMVAKEQNTLNEANLSSICECSYKFFPDSENGCYNTMRIEYGQRCFDSWNSSYCQTTDTSGIYTHNNDEGSRSPCRIRYGTFSHNIAYRAMVLNDFYGNLVYFLIRILT